MPEMAKGRKIVLTSLVYLFGYLAGGFLMGLGIMIAIVDGPIGIVITALGVIVFFLAMVSQQLLALIEVLKHQKNEEGEEEKVHI